MKMNFVVKWRRLERERERETVIVLNPLSPKERWRRGSISCASTLREKDPMPSCNEPNHIVYTYMKEISIVTFILYIYLNRKIISLGFEK